MLPNFFHTQHLTITPAATFYTLIETAKLNNINPVKYLHKVFEVIQDYKANRIEDLLPWNIKLK